MTRPLAPKAGKDIEFNKEFSAAYDLLENSGQNVFITGKAGTGKSTLLQYFRDHTVKKVAVLAPTGVAAVNIKGQTVHSFFRFKPDITPESVHKIRLRKVQRALYKKVDTIIIDEVSMVRADLLDCIDVFLRLHGKKPDVAFGGAQMVFIGDLFQLPPVVPRDEMGIFEGVYRSPYFFDAKIFREIQEGEGHPRSVKIVELKKIYRQQEEDFIKLLGSIRNRSVTEAHLKALNQRYIPHFKPPVEDFYIYLTTTNAMADAVNRKKLNELGNEPYIYEGTLTGAFEAKNLPTSIALELKVGAQVMLVNNDPSGRWINGSVGKIIDIADDGKIVGVELEDGSMVEVTPFKWEMFRFFFNEDTEQLESESVGSFTQYPLRLAWAVTIHKAQGKTFSKVIVDLGNGSFAHGQTYVALSRCTRLDGLVLKKPLLKRHILLDDNVVEFMNERFAANN